MQKTLLSKKVLAIILAAAVLICCFPAMYAMADFTPVNVLNTNVDSARCVQFYPSNHYVGDATRISAETIPFLTDGDTSTRKDCYGALDWDPPRYIGIEYTLDDSYYVGELKIYSGYTAYIDTFEVYASNSLEDLYNDESSLVASGVNCDDTGAQTLALNKTVKYVAFLLSGYTYNARIAEFEAWTADNSSTPDPGEPSFTSVNVLRNNVDSARCVQFYPSNHYVGDATRISAETIPFLTDGDTSTRKDCYGALDWDPPRYIGVEYTLDDSYYIGELKIYSGYTAYIDTFEVYASNSLEDLYNDESSLVASGVNCDDTGAQTLALNKTVKYVAFLISGYTYNARIAEFEAWTAESSSDPGTDPGEPAFTSVNVLRNNVTSSRCVQFYPSSHYVGDATRISAETIPFLTDGDLVTTKDCYSGLDWDPARYIGIEYSLDDTYYIGELKIYSGYTTSIDTFDVYASDSLDTLYNNDNCVATDLDCDGTAAQVISVNKNVRYVTFLISGVQLYCARIAEFEAWTAESSSDPGTDPGEPSFTPVNVLRNNVTSSRCVQFYPSNHYVDNASHITAETIAKLTDGDPVTTTDCSTALDWTPPRYLGVEYTLDDTYYIGELKIYSGFTTSVDTFDVYASDSFDTLYNDSNCVATGLDCDGTAAQVIAVNKNVRYVTFLISGIELYCARIAEFEAWTADSSAIPVDDGITRVLTIGNSFSENASIYASEIAYANNQQMMFGYLKSPSCTIAKHYNAAVNDIAGFKFQVTAPDGTRTTIKDGAGTSVDAPNPEHGATVDEALEYADWDIIVFQQESSNARNYDTFAQLPDLIDYVKTACPNARLMFHQVWRWGEWDADQFDLIKDASEKAVFDNALEIIPSGLAFEYARTALGSVTVVNEDDGHYQHASGYGQFIEGCCYVAKVFGIEISDDTFASHPYVNDHGYVTTLIAAANDAVAYYRTGDIDNDGTIDDKDLANVRLSVIDLATVRTATVRNVVANTYLDTAIDAKDYVRLKNYLLDPEHVTLR